MVGGVIAGVLALAIALVVALVTPGPTSSGGCVYATYPGPVGAQQIHACGATARSICASARSPGAFPSRAATQVVVGECRKAGLATGLSRAAR